MLALAIIENGTKARSFVQHEGSCAAHSALPRSKDKYRLAPSEAETVIPTKRKLIAGSMQLYRRICRKGH